jgi:hypothetical protein
VRYRARCRERRLTELLQVAECAFGNDECSSLTASLELKAERHSERSAVISSYAPRQTIGFTFIQIPHVHERVVDESLAHPARGVRLSFECV